MALYKQHGVNPAAGCLPMLIQLPVIWALYYVLQHAIVFKLTDVNKLVYFPGFRLQSIWSPDFFGLSLGHSPAQVISQGFKAGKVYSCFSAKTFSLICSASFSKYEARFLR